MAKVNQDNGRLNSPKPKVALDARLAYSLSEAASLLGISYSSAFRLCKRGELKASGRLRKRIISRKELQRFLEV